MIKNDVKIIEYEDKYLEDVRDLLVELEEYFKENDCKYIFVEAFAYNDMAIKFYENNKFHTRMYHMLKKIGE